MVRPSREHFRYDIKICKNIVNFSCTFYNAKWFLNQLLLEATEHWHGDNPAVSLSSWDWAYYIFANKNTFVSYGLVFLEPWQRYGIWVFQTVA